MNTTRDTKQRIFKNVSFLFGGKAAAGIIVAIENIVIARLLGVTEFGLLTMVVAYVKIINLLIDVRMWETATAYIGSFWSRRENDKVLSTIKLSYIVDVVTGTLAFLIVISSAKLAETYIIKSPETYSILFLYAFTLFISTANTTSKAIHRVFNKFRQIALVSVLRNVLRLVLAVAVLLTGMGVKGVVLAFVLTAFAEFLIWLYLVSGVLKENNLRGWWTARVGDIRDKWKEMAWFLANTSFTSTLKLGGDNYLGVLALAYFSGKDAAAYYKIARSTLDMLNRLVEPLREVMFPEIVRMLHSDALDEFREVVKYTLKRLTTLFVPLAVLIFVFADYIIFIVFGEKYLPATNAMRLLIVATIISQLVYWTNPALLALGKSGLRTLIGAVSLLGYLVFLVIFTPPYAQTGAAIAQVCYSVLTASLSLISLSIFMKKRRNEISSGIAKTVDENVQTS